MSVLIFHVFPESLPGGFIGVDIFFVISGFLISGILFNRLDQGRFSYTEFYTRRIKRIFPALIVVIVSCITVGWFLLFANEYEQLGKHIAAGAVFISNFILWGESSYFDNAAETKPLLHFWSLAIEEQFYIVWPILLWALWRFRANFLIAAIVLFSASFATNIHLSMNDPTAAFYSPISRAWELLAGSMLAYLNRYGPKLHHAYLNTQSISGFLLIVAGFLLINRSAYFPGYWALMPVLGTVMLISAGPNSLFNHHVLSNKLMVWVGLISYPLYLWHWPIISFFRISQNKMPDFYQGICIMVASVLLAWLTYRYVESPVRQSKKTGQLAIGLLVAILAIGALGYNLYSQAGLESRKIVKTSIRGDAQYNNLRNQVLSNEALRILDKERSAIRRWPTCNFTSRVADNPALFHKKAEKCLSLDAAKPNVMIYGDSHASDLWYSLSSQFPEVNFLQATASACFPGRDPDEVEIANVGCQRLTQHIYQAFDMRQLHLVMITARWRNEVYKEALLADIQYLQAKGVAVMLVGPMFEFSADLHSILRRGGEPKDYIKPDRFELDQDMATFFRANGVTYFSKINQVCATQNCLWNDGEKVLIFDYGHLTKHGMEVFGKIYRNTGVLQKHLPANQVNEVTTND